MAWLNQELQPWDSKRRNQNHTSAAKHDQGLMDATREKTGKEAMEVVSRIKETTIYGHYVDPNDALEISVATRADDAEVDTSMWPYGGLGREKEMARERIQKFLH
jgi:hypothetical protein